VEILDQSGPEGVRVETRTPRTQWFGSSPSVKYVVRVPADVQAKFSTVNGGVVGLVRTLATELLQLYAARRLATALVTLLLASVLERTREIGVRKALGATRLNILMQFLIEALTLCLLGGILGILLGIGAAVVLAKVMQWNTLISPIAIAIAFGFSAAVGLFFGLWPARRASRLDPIVALRYE
jgi:predicted lysophospholipase L1 biosynthesis ABC-type transport system permease subunit